MIIKFSSIYKIVCAVSLFSMTFVAASCKKFVEIDPAPGIIQTSSIFESDKTAASAVSGLYTQLRSSSSTFTNGGLSLYCGLASDEIYATSPTSTTDPFFLNQLVPSNAQVSSVFYTPSYKIIYQVNAILEGLENSNLLTDSVKKQLTGEAKIVRALAYFYLVNLFGDVPLIITTDYLKNATLPRTATNRVYEQIITDLTDAQNLLKLTYPSAGKVRPNKLTATALLARVYLNKKDWQNAEIQASLVISSGQYALTPILNNVFLKNSNETIWEIASPNEGTSPGEAQLFIPSSTTVKPTYAITTYLLNTFESGDQRKTSSNWLGKNTVSAQDYYFPNKYKQRSISTGGTPNEYEVVFRLAEQYLIRAEALAQQNNISGSQNDLNKIRNRASLPNTSANTQSSLITAIEKEKRIEFFAEWGHRWLDLKRTDRSNSVLQPIKGANWAETDTFWPIPETELLYNVSLIQNPGY